MDSHYIHAVLYRELNYSHSWQNIARCASSDIYAYPSLVLYLPGLHSDCLVHVSRSVTPYGTEFEQQSNSMYVHVLLRLYPTCGHVWPDIEDLVGLKRGWHVYVGLPVMAQ